MFHITLKSVSSFAVILASVNVTLYGIFSMDLKKNNNCALRHAEIKQSFTRPETKNFSLVYTFIRSGGRVGG